MSTSVHTEDLHIDRKVLMECLEDAIRQVNEARPEIIVSIGGVELHVDFPNSEIYVMA